MTDNMSIKQPANILISNDLSNKITSTMASQNSTNPHSHDDNNIPLRLHVERAVRQYIAEMGDELPTDLYQLILAEVEKPLLTVVFEQTCGNQSKCAQILGLNRGTLRKKLKTYALIS